MWIPNQYIITWMSRAFPQSNKNSQHSQNSYTMLSSLRFHSANLRSGTYTVSLGGGVALAGESCITDQITDHLPPYWHELALRGSNKIRVLDECWRMNGEHNTLSLRHMPPESNIRLGHKHQIILDI